MKYPCNKCIISMMCKDPCEEFGAFVQTLVNFEDKTEKLFEGLDDFICGLGIKKLENFFDWIGTVAAVPILYFYISIKYRVKVNEDTAFDIRYESWQRKERAKK